MSSIVVWVTAFCDTAAAGSLAKSLRNCSSIDSVIGVRFVSVPDVDSGVISGEVVDIVRIVALDRKLDVMKIFSTKEQSPECSGLCET